MATYTWTHGGSPTTQVAAAFAGAAGAGSSTPDFVTAMNTWIGTGDENGTTGTLNFTADGSAAVFATFSMAVQLEDPGINPADTMFETSVAFDYTIVNGPMATGDATSTIVSTWDGTDDPQAEGTIIGSYARTIDGVTLGTPTFGDFFAAVGFGGIAALAFTWNCVTSGGTFSAHNRSITVSNLVITATDGATTPVVTDVSPAHGDAAGGTVVTLTGTDLDTGTNAFFNGTAASGYSASSSTQATCIAPAHAVGQVTVMVA